MLETESLSPLDQLRQRWENLNKDQSTKLQLSLSSLELDQLSPVHMSYIVDLLFSAFSFVFQSVNRCCFVFKFDVVSHLKLIT